jgi:hypothetical protein
MIGFMFNISEIQKLDIYVKNFIKLLACEKKNSNYKTLSKYFINCSLGIRNEEDYDYYEAEDDAFTDFDTIYRHSKFYQHYNDFFNNLSVTKYDHRKDDNVFYNINFIVIFLKKYVAFLPLWSNILSRKRDKNASRSNNGLIEGKKFSLLINQFKLL